MYRGQDRGALHAVWADYAVAKRWQEWQNASVCGEFLGMVEPVRFPEEVVMFDNGDVESVSAQGIESA
jgi:hypothetical protein